MLHDLIHQKILAQRSAVDQWFREKSSQLTFPFYSSFDIRDSGNIIAPVDANIFPAGFNNICPDDQQKAKIIVDRFLDVHYPNVKKIALLVEEHTSNLFYWHNVSSLVQMLKNSNREIFIVFPQKLKNPMQISTDKERSLSIYGSEVVEEELRVNNEKNDTVDLIICNNDFSEARQDWVKNLKTPMNPPYTLGWHRRQKSVFFEWYNQLAGEFAQVIDLSPQVIQVSTEKFTAFDVNDSQSREKLAVRVDQFIAHLEKKYFDLQWNQKPFVFIKHNSGTYGMGILTAKSGDEIRNWNAKLRKKMKSAKGGQMVAEVIIQEGIPTRIVTDNETAEPTIYMIGCHLAGGFLRAHSQKGPDENLNSPGAVFKRLCVSDLKVNVAGAPMENVYGWLAKLGFLALAHEIKQLETKFNGYQPGCSL